MSLKQKFVSAITLAFAIVTFTVFASAQDKTTTPSDAPTRDQIERRGPRGEGRGMHGDRHHGPRGPEMMLRALHRLNLTDAQKEQIHSILEAQRGGSEATREQLGDLRRAKHEGTITAAQQAQLDSLRAEMKKNAEATHQTILGILTAEQRTQLDQMKQEMDKRREENRERREEFRQNRRQGDTSPAKTEKDQ